jgi:hypothetical protein
MVIVMCKHGAGSETKEPVVLGSKELPLRRL